MTGLESVANDAKKLDFIAEVGATWIKRPTPPNNGVLLVGSVKETSREGGLVQVQLDVGGSGPAVVLCGDVAAAPNAPERTRVLASGVIVREPAKALRGYEGTAESVVWLQSCTALSAP